MDLAIKPLNGEFGVMLAGVTPDDLRSTTFRRRAYQLWLKHGGVTAVRGPNLVDLSPAELVEWSEQFGVVEQDRLAGRERNMVDGYPILRIGNLRDRSGTLRSVFSEVPALTSDADIRYNPATRRPVWHTDSTFKPRPPIGSVFHCKQAPARGGETLFADTRGAYAALEDSERRRLDGLEAVCSLAHHDKKISLYNTEYPTLSATQRAANPPQRVPVVLSHPLTGTPALYGLNSSTCAVVPVGTPVSEERMDQYDTEGIEDDSVLILRDLLPHITGPKFTVKWQWQPGDIVVWDNRCTMHAASGFDHHNELREMWRLTLVEDRGQVASEPANH